MLNDLYNNRFTCALMYPVWFKDISVCMCVFCSLFFTGLYNSCYTTSGLLCFWWNVCKLVLHTAFTDALKPSTVWINQFNINHVFTQMHSCSGCYVLPPLAILILRTATSNTSKHVFIVIFRSTSWNWFVTLFMFSRLLILLVIF